MTAKTDVFKAQPTASFRGIAFPITERDVTHSHDTVEHRLQYRDGRLIEITGGSNKTFTYTIPFRQGIARGPYKDLFVKTLPEFWLAYADKSRGTLVDPITGVSQVVPGSWDEITDVNRRDGIDVRVSFIESPELADDAQESGIETVMSAYGEAQALDTELSKVDWQQEPSPPPMTDPLSAIAGLGSQIAAVPAKVAANLHAVAFRCEKVEATLAKLKDPETTTQVVHAARRLRLSCQRMADEGANPARTVKQITYSTAKPLSAIAQELHNSVDDLVKLNAQLVRMPLVPAEFVIKHYG
jgi:hypothetical protein